MKNKPLVSVVIPCYNAEAYISETINSVLNQNYKNFDILVINDGSTDKSEFQILQFQDDRIKYLAKQNTGVSDTRNIGFSRVTGDYILFLDSDDLLTPDFLETRIELLEENPSLVFCCGRVIKVNACNEYLSGEFRGTFNNIFEEVLLYDQVIITCPSNYVFRKDFLEKNNILFNTRLSSTADRYFLIEVGRIGKGGYIEQGGELLYRVSQDSMSNKLSKNLIDDNALFCNMVLSKGYLPETILKEFYFKINYILGAAYIRLGVYKKGFYFLMKSLRGNPFRFAGNIFKKVLFTNIKK